ncbi:hypothetical protein [Gloeobacter morelensis]|uniref:GNAT family N-acetyltransferase n=1 Tax=Gloeobacter morelensis MG652769 TaxID=2781736 RepID=A0ABY3PKH8_9CYAN|nr:hypothetical protein [Gloeobacter morelensis]UFP94089.1 hypothetical protein ISF26_20355 [Gloeobacter morelensis MG652769]
MEKTLSLRPTTEADLDFVLAQEQSPDNRPYIVMSILEQEYRPPTATAHLDTL